MGQMVLKIGSCVEYIEKLWEDNAILRCELKPK